MEVISRKLLLLVLNTGFNQKGLVEYSASPF